MFRSGAWTDDDEVCVVHADRDQRFRPLSEPMANIRFTLRRMRRTGRITSAAESVLIAAMKARHFSERTRATLVESGVALFGDRAVRFVTEFAEHYYDVKRQDAALLVSVLLDPKPPRPSAPPPCFPRTIHWVSQFEIAAEEIPPLPERL